MSVEIHTPAAAAPLEANARLARISDVELPPLSPDSDRWPGRTVRVAGVDIFVRHTPGPDGAERALLVHGLGGASTNWTDFAGLLASQLDVEAIDLPGFGYSGRAKDDNYSIAMQAATVIAYLDWTKQNNTDENPSWRGPVHLVGNSMGGLISIEVAARRPDLVRTLTLISPAVPDLKRFRFHPLQNDRLMALVVVPGLGEYGVRRLMKTEIEQRARGTLRICFADPSRYPANRFAQDIEDITHEDDREPVDAPRAAEGDTRAGPGSIPQSGLRVEAARHDQRADARALGRSGQARGARSGCAAGCRDSECAIPGIRERWTYRNDRRSRAHSSRVLRIIGGRCFTSAAALMWQPDIRGERRRP